MNTKIASLLAAVTLVAQPVLAGWSDQASQTASHSATASGHASKSVSVLGWRASQALGQSLLGPKYDSTGGSTGSILNPDSTKNSVSQTVTYATDLVVAGWVSGRDSTKVIFSDARESLKGSGQSIQGIAEVAAGASAYVVTSGQYGGDLIKVGEGNAQQGFRVAIVGTAPDEKGGALGLLAAPFEAAEGYASTASTRTKAYYNDVVVEAVGGSILMPGLYLLKAKGEFVDASGKVVGQLKTAGGEAIGLIKTAPKAVAGFVKGVVVDIAGDSSAISKTFYKSRPVQWVVTQIRNTGTTIRTRIIDASEVSVIDTSIASKTLSTATNPAEIKRALLDIPSNVSQAFATTDMLADKELAILNAK
jgi:hypothetical protein